MGIHVIGEFWSEEDAFDSDYDQQSLKNLVRRYKADVEITFQTCIVEGDA